jgi:hypothetical protein
MSYYETAAKMFLEARWREKAGLDTTAFSFDQREDLAKLRHSEMNNEFVTLLRNRMVMGRFRYGHLAGEGKADWDRLSRIEKEVIAYRVDGNDERLIDIANMCQLEFTEGKHPNKHFASSDDAAHNKEIR